MIELKVTLTINFNQNFDLYKTTGKPFTLVCMVD